MSWFLLLLIANPSAPVAEPWVGESPAAEAESAVESVRYDQQPIAPNPAQSPAPTASVASADSFEQRVLALEIALSTLVAERPTLWRFDRLEAEAAALLSQAPTEADRRAVRGIADRIDGFARIAARHRQARDADGWRRPADRGALAANDRLAPPVRLTKAPVRRPSEHDFEGVLRPVVSKRPEAPKYAIVDDEGKIATLVTPQPELAKQFENLVGKRVGLDGRRGFLTDLRREHLVAERVTPLRSPKLRR